MRSIPFPINPLIQPAGHIQHDVSDHHHRVQPQQIPAKKPDRYLIGLLAGMTLFYLMGKAFGLGHR